MTVVHRLFWCVSGAPWCFELIAHYVEVHDYLPPPDFVEAALSSDVAA
ncbi:hypothetical protein [Streptomyces sp.]|nr:hypothetical protein [Streptomyces sp.]HET6360366.1 hypothetical protein [Streptomyces sp.]